MIRYVAVTACSALIILAFFVAGTDAQEGTLQEDSSGKQDDRIVIPEDENSISRRDFMRTKLLFSQDIFEGLTTGDFTLIQSAVREVQTVTEGEQWVTIDNEEYRRLVEEFKVTTERLLEASKTENIDATALRYYQMSTSCVDCHKHIRKAGYSF